MMAAPPGAPAMAQAPDASAGKAGTDAEPEQNTLEWYKMAYQQWADYFKQTEGEGSAQFQMYAAYAAAFAGRSPEGVSGEHYALAQNALANFQSSAAYKPKAEGEESEVCG